MLTSLAGLMLGRSEPKLTEAEVSEKTCDEDEWVLVDVKEEAVADAQLFELIHIAAASGPVSAESSAHPSPGGGWHVTPPVCFRDGSNDISLLESSGFENLLIEHPSRSVYIRPQTQPDSVATLEADPNNRVRRPTAEGRPLRILDLLQPAEINCPQEEQRATLIAKKKLNGQNYLKRQNLVEQINGSAAGGSSRPRRMKLKDFSGKNNDRKCQ